MKKRSRLFYFQLLLTLMICSFLIVPVIQSILAGITVNFLQGIKSGITFRWFVKVWDLYKDTIFRSIYIALSCLATTLVAGVPAAYAMVKKQNRLIRLFEEFLVMPLAIPGLAIALALLINYGRFTGFRRSWLFILTGHVIFTLPFMIRSVIAVMNSFNLSDLEEGAASLGAGFWQRFIQIVIPNAMPGILAGSLMVFTLSIGEFNLTWMLATPLTKTLPVGLADSYASMRLEIGSAYTIVFFFMIIPLLMAMQWVAKPHKKEIRVEEINNQEHKDYEKTDRKTKSTSSVSDIKEKPQTKNGTSLRMENCEKTFSNGTRALELFNLEVGGGETLVVLGPSGCGKTTMLRILAGLESPDPGGKVFFDDEEVTDIPIEKRNVGMVFQSYALFPNMTVAENIAYGLKIRGDRKEARENRVNEMLEMMQIRELRSRQINQLSGGQKQRVALARAIAVRPRVLLLDEPLTALDAKLRDILRVEIDSLLRSLGITAIYVTHDQAEAMAIGDRIVVMDIGRMAQIGTPREIYFKPRNRFVADFIGTINRYSCHVQNGKLIFPNKEISLENTPFVHFNKEEMLSVFFRPEHASVTTLGNGHFTVTVLASFFMGDRTRLIVQAPNNEQLTVETGGQQSFVKGQQVDIKIDPSTLMTLTT